MFQNNNMLLQNNQMYPISLNQMGRMGSDSGIQEIQRVVRNEPQLRASIQRGGSDMQASIVKYDDNISRALLDKVDITDLPNNETIIMIAKSVMSTGIVKSLNKMFMIGSVPMSSNQVCINIMNSIPLESITVDKDILKYLLLNEFYKIGMEVSLYTGKELAYVIDIISDDMSSLSSTVISVLKRLKK